MCISGTYKAFIWLHANSCFMDMLSWSDKDMKKRCYWCFIRYFINVCNENIRSNHANVLLKITCFWNSRIISKDTTRIANILIEFASLHSVTAFKVSITPIFYRESASLNSHCSNLRDHLFLKLINSKSSRPEVFCKKGVLKSLQKFTGKNLCWILRDF